MQLLKADKSADSLETIARQIEDWPHNKNSIQTETVLVCGNYIVYVHQEDMVFKDKQRVFDKFMCEEGGKISLFKPMAGPCSQYMILPSYPQLRIDKIIQIRLSENLLCEFNEFIRKRRLIYSVIQHRLQARKKQLKQAKLKILQELELTYINNYYRRTNWEKQLQNYTDLQALKYGFTQKLKKARLNQKQAEQILEKNKDLKRQHQQFLRYCVKESSPGPHIELVEQYLAQTNITGTVKQHLVNFYNNMTNQHPGVRMQELFYYSQLPRAELIDLLRLARLLHLQGV